MSRPTVQQTNFIEFRRALERARAAGTRIVPGEKDRWQRYVTEHGVRERNFQAYAAGKYQTLEPVIIDEPGEWGGYYLWSATEEVALRWHRPV
jgi:hypothetical protein